MREVKNYEPNRRTSCRQYPELPLPEQWRVLAWLNEYKPALEEKASELSETEIARLLLAQGVIKSP
jgi:hypothetical protein